MKISGSYKLNAKKEVVWRALNNPEILKQCIPGCESFEKESDTVFNAIVTNKVGPMNATFSGKVIVSNIQKNQSYTLSGEGQSPVGFANGAADVELSEEYGMTTLSYQINVNVGGKIVQLGSRLIDSVAKKMSDYFFGRFADIIAPVNNKTGETVEGKRVGELKSNFLNKYIYSIAVIFFLLLVVIFYFVSR
jgi:hypothetical protein